MRLLSVVTALSLFASFAAGQTPEVPAFPNPIGSGARAAAMADTFISIADDASAASWNPAGLTQLERPEISIVGDLLFRDDGWNFDSDGGYRFSLRDGRSDDLSLNYLSAVYPFRALDHNWVVSLNLQQGYRFDREFRLRYCADTEGFSDSGLFHFEQEGALYALSPALAFLVTPRLSLGVAVNFWMDDIASDFAWVQKRHQIGEDTDFGRYDIQETNTYSDLFGANFHLGFRYEATEHLTVGAVARTPFEAELKHQWVLHTDAEAENGTNESQTVSAELDFPWSVGVGLSWRFSDEFSTSMDVMRTDWSHFVIADNLERRHLITGEDTSDGDVDPTYSVRTGAEYLVIGETIVVPLRCGFAYDPQPSRHSPDTVFLAAGGAGLVIRDRISLDFAYQYRFGNVDAGKGFGEIEVRQHRFVMAAVVYF